MRIHSPPSDFSRIYLLFLVVFQCILSFLVEPFPLVAALYGILPSVIAILMVLYNRNRNNEALLGSAYIMGAEIVWRITQGYASYEFAKYSITLILLLGVLVEKEHRKWDKGVLIYFISFIPATVIAFLVIPDSERFRQLSSILSGPFCLVVCIFYFSNRVVDQVTFTKAFQLFSATMITVLFILFIFNPDLEAINYRSQSNFQTSGGFGPNQVSTVLGLGILIVCIFTWVGKRVTGFLVTDVLLLAMLIFRGFLTFSRGGMFGAVVSVAVFIIAYSIYHWKSTWYFVRLALFTVCGLIMITVIWDNLADITGGQIVNRYAGRDSRGRPLKDLSSGRSVIGIDEIMSFRESPLIGVGLSYSKFIRSEKTGIFVNTHDEFTRTLAEQGLLGAVGLLSIFVIASRNYSYRSHFSKATFWAFLVIFIITLLHSAMRLSMVPLIFGIALAIQIPKKPYAKTAVSKWKY